MGKALGRSLKPLNTFLLDPKVQKVLGNISVPSALKDVVKKLNSIKSMLSTTTLLNLFDEVIHTFKGLIAKLKSLAPDEVITWMESALISMQYVRTQADKMLPNALKEAIYKLEDLELALKKQIKSLEQPHKALADTKSIHRLDDSVAQIDPHIIRSMKNSQKGIYGEIISDHHMKERGFINLLPEDRQVRKMTDKPRGRGIDGIYQTVLAHGDREVWGDDLMYLLIAQFIQSIKDPQTTPLATGEIGLRNLELQQQVMQFAFSQNRDG